MSFVLLISGDIAGVLNFHQGHVYFKPNGLYRVLPDELKKAVKAIQKSKNKKYIRMKDLEFRRID